MALRFIANLCIEDKLVMEAAWKILPLSSKNDGILHTIISFKWPYLQRFINALTWFCTEVRKLGKRYTTLNVVFWNTIHHLLLKRLCKDINVERRKNAGVLCTKSSMA